MVDTGATSVALGASDARRANISLSNARPILVQTANGIVPGLAGDAEQCARRRCHA
jgi:predicted aspartyl protease